MDQHCLYFRLRKKIIEATFGLTLLGFTCIICKFVFMGNIIRGIIAGYLDYMRCILYMHEYLTKSADLFADNILQRLTVSAQVKISHEHHFIQ